MPSSTGDADPLGVPQPTRDGRGSGGSPLHSGPGDLADGPRWLLDKAGGEDWQTAEWLRWERLRKRFIYLRVEPRYSDHGTGHVSCSWLDDDVAGLPTIASMLRSGDPFPILDALTRLMEAVAAARRQQVRDSLDNTE